MPGGCPVGALGRGLLLVAGGLSRILTVCQTYPHQCLGGQLLLYLQWQIPQMSRGKDNPASAFSKAGGC